MSQNLLVGLATGRRAVHRAEGRRRHWNVPALALALATAVVALTMATAGPAWATSGGAVAWGDNASGQLGNGTTLTAVEPVTVKGLTEAMAITASEESYSMALLSNGTVMAWGENGYGQLGNGTTNNASEPVAVTGLSGATAISAGARHSLALLSNGTVEAWGHNETGELGDGKTENEQQSSDVPVQVSKLTGVVAIAAGSSHSYALLSNGTVMAWGENGEGQLGNGTTKSATEPVAVTGLSGVVAISAGVDYGLALLSNGTVKAWGLNDFGQLGDGQNEKEQPYSDVPVTVSGLSGATAIAAGGNDSLALLSNGTVMAWGLNIYGQLGDKTSTGPEICKAGFSEDGCSRTPVTVSGLSGATAIAAGGNDSLALLSNHTAVAWGENAYGQLGNGTMKNASEPVAVTGLSGATAIADGGHDNLALLKVAKEHGWEVNGPRIGSSPRLPIALLGTSQVLVIKNPQIGEISCHSLGAANIWNQGEFALASVESFNTYDCVAQPACPEAIVTAEKPVELTEKEGVKAARRGALTVPWYSHVINGVEGGPRRLQINSVHLNLVLPCDGMEIPMEGTLEPQIINGNKNGLSPSHLQFSTTTGVLKTSVLPSEEGKNVFTYTGEQPAVGGMDVELVTTE